MGSMRVEVPVFTQTNLGTRITLAVSPDITAGYLKGELERAHIDCFPELGFISIDAVMVKCNSYSYHLPDLLPLKHVFKALQGSWFVHVNASLSNNIKSDKQNPRSKAVLIKPELVTTADPSGKRRKRKRRKRKRKPKVKIFPESFSHKIFEPKGITCNASERDKNGQQEVLHASKASDSNATAESPHGSLSGPVSVSHIINRYFTHSINLDHIGSSSGSEAATRTGQCDVNIVSFSKNSSIKHNSVNPRQILLPSPLPEDSVTLTNKYERSEVGKRVVVASNNLGSSQRSILSKSKKLRDADTGSIARSLVYEIDEND